MTIVVLLVLLLIISICLVWIAISGSRLLLRVFWPVLVLMTWLGVIKKLHSSHNERDTGSL